MLFFVLIFPHVAYLLNERDGGQKRLLRHLPAPPTVQKWRTASMGHLGLVFLFLFPLICLSVRGKILALHLNESA